MGTQSRLALEVSSRWLDWRNVTELCRETAETSKQGDRCR
jgi:hypothetical protein